MSGYQNPRNWYGHSYGTYLKHKNTLFESKVDTTYIVSIISQVILSRSRTWTSFNSFLLISSPPNNITLEPTSVADCPARATWESKLKTSNIYSTTIKMTSKYIYR